MPMIYASVSPDLISKADLFFRNDDTGIFAELVQNSRRAGADRIQVTISQLPGDEPVSQVAFSDNGRGIEDFKALLRFGGSQWTEQTKRAEDPAGMGFFSLCHREVEVASGDQIVTLNRDVFLGKTGADQRTQADVVPGTRITFTRPWPPERIASALKAAAEFCPVTVYVNGEELPSHDFLGGALHRETIDGIEVGFAPSFTWGKGSSEDNWNFYGVRIREHVQGIPGLMRFDRYVGWHTQTLQVRFNVLDTTVVKLQLPDRRGIVHEENFPEFLGKVRAAAYRFFVTEERHTLPYANWKEAKDLGVNLPEASPVLRTWHAEALDSYLDPFFGRAETELLGTTEPVLLVSRDIEHRHTFEAALRSAPLEGRFLYEEADEFEGYSWYQVLPRVSSTVVRVDGMTYEEWKDKKLPRPSTMELTVLLEQSGRQEPLSQIPIAIYVPESEGAIWDDDGIEFVAVRNSPWDNETLAGPFDVAEFILYVTFSSNDGMDSDSWDTQKSEYEAVVERLVNAYFRGPRAALRALMGETLSWEARQYAEEAGVHEIRLYKSGPEANPWKVELIGGDQ